MAHHHALPWNSHLGIIARLILWLPVFLVVHWVAAYLGGWSIRPKQISATANDTGPIFNWHPTLMILGWVLMGEAILAYKAPLAALTRDQSKMLHGWLHTLAWLSLSIGITAAFKSHSLHLPSPFPDLYSVHSYIGLFAFIAGGLQFVIGFAAYWYPTAALNIRRAISPNHIFWGKVIWVAFIGAILSGLQEKTTFTQLGMHPDAFSPIMRLPAIVGLLTAIAGAAVIYVHAAKPTTDKAHDRADEEPLIGQAPEGLDA